MGCVHDKWVLSNRLEELNHSQWRGEIFTRTLCLHGVPDVAVKVVVAGEQQPSGLRERHGGDSTDDVVMRVHR